MATMAPGVYVTEVPSADKPIAGVGTSTAGFIGMFTDDASEPFKGDASTKVFKLKAYPVVTTTGTYKITVAGTERTDGRLTADDTNKTVTVTLGDPAPAANDDVVVTYKVPAVKAASDDVKLCTNFTEFTTWFGNFSTVAGQSKLAHAVYGFFSNGGTRCYVARTSGTDISTILSKFEAIDEIAIVAAPGITDVRDKIITHCESMQDRFGILDCKIDDKLDNTLTKPAATTYAGFYYPWLKVFDPLAKAANPNGDGGIFVPPSGHLAGIYARVDSSRGVHKAPANEVVLGALDVSTQVSKSQQAGVNEDGVNCIRSLNGNILVWGARTLAGPSNKDLKYINVRRLLMFLRESIEEGTQWVVFEPNTPALWQKIKRNITAFLTNVWRDGALFGDTAQEAFYVKCDAELNPPSVRDDGQVVTEIGVAIVRPAEFVVFRISQWSGPDK